MFHKRHYQRQNVTQKTPSLRSTSKGPKMHSSYKYNIGNCWPTNLEQFSIYRDMGFEGCQPLILFKLFDIWSSLQRPLSKKVGPSSNNIGPSSTDLGCDKICLACLGCLVFSPLSAVSNIWLSFCRDKSGHKCKDQLNV